MNNNTKNNEKQKSMTPNNNNPNNDLNNSFKELNFKVGKVVELTNLADSDKVYLLKIDVGEKTPREIGSALRLHIDSKDILNHNVIVFVNLKPKKLNNFSSNGMIMCASSGTNHEVIELLNPSESK